MKEKFQVPDKLKLKTTSEITHNTRAKLYPLQGLVKFTYCSSPVFREPGWELIDPPKRDDYERGKRGENVREDSLRRSKGRVFDYAMLNQFEWFCTWTLSKERINRYDPKEVAEKMQNFLANKVQRKDLKYIIVPEYHKDGAIHAHGFMSGNLTMHNSGKRDAVGRAIFNVEDWKFGFTNAVRISGNYQKACHYIKKYISKKGRMIFGNFYYAGGHGLIRAADCILGDTDYRSIDAKEFCVEEAGVSYKYRDYEAERQFCRECGTEADSAVGKGRCKESNADLLVVAYGCPGCGITWQYAVNCSAHS
jgi:hypothetical protein